jgi:hypothetical protein
MEVKVGIIGSANAGKTVYLSTLLWMLVRPEAQAEAGDNLVDLAGQPDDPDTWNFWTSGYNALASGKWPPHTERGERKPVQIRLRDGDREHTVHFQDLAGGDIERVLLDPKNPDLGPIRQWYEQCTAFMFLIAPSRDLVTEYSSVYDLVVPPDDPQVLFVNRLIHLLADSAGALVDRPTAFVFTRRDMFADAAGKQMVAAKQVFPRLNLIKTQFPTHEFFWCTSTGPLDRTDPERPVPRKGRLAPKNVVEPLAWLLAELQNRQDMRDAAERAARKQEAEAAETARKQKAESAAKDRRRKKRRLIGAAVIAAMAAAAGWGGVQYNGNAHRLTDAAYLIADARANAVDPIAARRKLEEAEQLLDGMSGLGAGRPERAALLRDARGLISDVDLRALKAAVDLLAPAVTATGLTPAECEVLARDLSGAADQYWRTRKTQAEAGNGADPNAAAEIERLGRALSDELEAAMRLALRAPTRRSVTLMAGAAARRLAAGPEAAARKAGAADPDRQRFTTLLADGVARLDPAEFTGRAGEGGDVFESAPDLCRDVFDRLCPRYVEAANVAGKVRVREVLFGVCAALGEKNRAVVRAHVAHIQACAVLDANSARTPAVLDAYEKVWVALAAEQDAGAALLQLRAREEFVAAAQALLDESARQAAAGQISQSVAVLTPVAASLRTSKLIAAGSAPEATAGPATMSPSEGPSARQRVDAALLACARALPADALDRQESWQFYEALCSATPDAESPIVAVVAESLVNRGRYGSAAAFVKGLPARTWRDARLNSIGLACDAYVARIDAAYLLPDPAGTGRTGPAARRPLNVAVARKDPAGFLQAVDALEACARDTQQYPRDTLPEFGPRLSAMRSLQAALLAGGTRQAASPDGEQRLAAALNACDQGKPAAARQQLGALSRYDQIQLARESARVTGKLIPILDRLAEASQLPVRARRMDGCLRAADDLDALAAASDPVDAPPPAGGAGIGTTISGNRERAVRRAVDELQSWQREEISALSADTPDAAASLLPQVVGTEIDAALRRLVPTEFAASLGAVCTVAKERLAVKTGAPTAGERALATTGAIWLPEGTGLLRVAAARYGASAGGLLAACGLHDQVRAELDRLAGLPAPAPHWAAAWSQARSDLARADGDLRARVVAGLAHYIDVYAPGGEADRNRIVSICVGKPRQAAFIRDERAQATLLGVAASRQWYAAEERDRMERALKAVAEAAADVNACVPLSVCRDPRDRRILAFNIPAAGAPTAADPSPLPAMCWLGAEGPAQYDSTIKAISAFLDQAARVGSPDDVDKLLYVADEAGGGRERFVMLHGYKDPLIVIDSNAFNAFAFAYGDPAKRAQQLYTEKRVAEWQRFLLVETVKVASCLADASPLAPPRLKQLAADLRQPGPTADRDAIGRVLARYAAAPAKPQEFDMPANFQP